MTKMVYVFYLMFIVISLVSMLLLDRDVLVGELALSILFTLSLLRKLWKLEHSENGTTTRDEQTGAIQRQDEVHYAEINLDEQKLWLKKRQQIMENESTILKQSAVYKHFFCFLSNPSKLSLSDADWDELIQILEDVIPNFKSVLVETEQMSRDDYRLCVLIRYGFKPSEIAIIMGKTSSFITRMRQNLLQKIFHVSGTASELDIRLLDIF